MGKKQDLIGSLETVDQVITFEKKLIGYDDKGPGVLGQSNIGIGMLGKSHKGEGVHAETRSDKDAAIVALMINENGTGAGIYTVNNGKGAAIHAKGGRVAGLFEGDVEVTGKLTVKVDIILTNGDLAEDFDVEDISGPGEVMVLTENGSLNRVQKHMTKKWLV
jgi:hypothetical protein